MHTNTQATTGPTFREAVLKVPEAVIRWDASEEALRTIREFLPAFTIRRLSPGTEIVVMFIEYTDHVEYRCRAELGDLVVVFNTEEGRVPITMTPEQAAAAFDDLVPRGMP